MPSPFRSLFKPHKHDSHSSAQISIQTPNSSTTFTTDVSENSSSAIDRPTVTVVSQSEGVGSKSTPSVSVSPARSVAVNGLKFALRQLGKAPVPGIEVATSCLLEIISRIQVNQETSLEKYKADLVQEHSHSRQGV
ncbi:hypothetical protein PILCRDRAFT_480785 [Piloderma croceum F 1598]|uniref:Uncharacterized protein n=1 Tax=Piloderma croceum (strain F 1598) TaxID=765440 RepID=A0A0C3BX27_PILCF|nr:hypothetical protein PILCRDRAFT_480785 [Piloderma croceum F 1598]